MLTYLQARYDELYHRVRAGEDLPLGVLVEMIGLSQILDS